MIRAQGFKRVYQAKLKRSTNARDSEQAQGRVHERIAVQIMTPNNGQIRNRPIIHGALASLAGLLLLFLFLAGDSLRVAWLGKPVVQGSGLGWTSAT
jgi:hypothetical protein